MSQKENQRVRLTKRLLKDALIDILMDVPLQKVTITEICARAEINRTTFYKYYASEYELYADIENDFISVLSENIVDAADAGLETLLHLIRANPKMATAMLNNSSEESLSQRIFLLPEMTRNNNFKRLERAEQSAEVLFFIFSGAYAFIKKWINEGFVRSPGEVAAFLNRMVSRIVY